ncbi:MAG: hypothetical protein IPN17_26070 [Deltaproteobacteria bacterium]|nr:hypothetical protein [Deltaproteobacteria bacterium]
MLNENPPDPPPRFFASGISENSFLISSRYPHRSLKLERGVRPMGDWSMATAPPERLPPVDGLMGQWLFSGELQLLPHRPLQDLLHQRALAAARHARHAQKRPNGNFAVVD